MEEIKNKCHSHKKHGIIFGIILIVLGALFLLFSLGLLEGNMKSVIFSWQMLLIVCSIFPFCYRNFLSGSFLLILGLFFMIPKLVDTCPDTFGWFGNDFTAKYWPTLLIALGILIIIGLFFPKSRKNNHDKIFIDINAGIKQHKKNNGSFERNVVFGSAEEIILDPVFAGGDINSVFGSIILDLRKTTIPEGDTELELNCSFGGITLYIPDNWNVELHINHFMSGFEDKRNIRSEIDFSRKLIITGAFAFGGGEIRN
ncbi:MAG: cell wall-active antibiotics response protein [Prevotellaceae bacterium]|jgi:predicted membrane protein|nr:cell wall-active antibiotics response protein [Prevotellaceae bacterium]